MHGRRPPDRRQVRDEQRRAARSQREHLARDIGADRGHGDVRRATSRINRLNWLWLAVVVAVMAVFTATLISRQRPAELDVKADCGTVTVHFDQTSYGAQDQMLFRVTGPAGPTYRVLLRPNDGGKDIVITPEFTMRGCRSHTMADRAPEDGEYDVVYQTVDTAGKVQQSRVVSDLIVA